MHAARDPVWVADGFVSERWMAISPVSGRLDAFEWKVPLAELSASAPVTIEAPDEPAHAELPELPREVASPPLGNVMGASDLRNTRTNTICTLVVHPMS